jgi:hypothetical protein
MIPKSGHRFSEKIMLHDKNVSYFAGVSAGTYRSPNTGSL